MDFNALMQAASKNSTSAKLKKEPVLVTKLSAPKKEERKVDVAAIRKRLDEEKRRLESPKPVKAHTSIKPQNDKIVAKPSGKPVEKVIKKNVAEKYDNKQHEQKHKHFMDSINKIGRDVDLKSKSRQTLATSTSNKLMTKPVTKPKSIGAPPSFKDLLSLAEKGVKDPSVLSQSIKTVAEKHESRSKVPNTSTSTKLKKPVTPSKAAMSTCSLPQKAEGDLSKRQTLNSKSTSTLPSQRAPTLLTGTKSTAHPSKQDNGGKDKHVILSSNAAGKRPSSLTSSDEPPVKKVMSAGSDSKPQLSAAAMAKLAYREGRRAGVSPPTSSKLSTSSPRRPDMSNTRADKPVRPAVAASTKPGDQVRQKSEFEGAPGVSAWDRLMGQNGRNASGSASNGVKSKKKPTNNRYIDSEEEDDDLDDFIDDGEDDIDYSAAIRDIFGYDKSRYRDEDFDDRSMVAKYSDIMKEEVRSAKIGRQEDLNDMMMEEEEKRRKKAMKKSKSKK